MLPGSAPLLYPAPPWQPDRSEYVVLWHCCTALARDSIEATGIDLARCAVDTDFGRGFYTTTLERQARSWAWRQRQQWLKKNPGSAGNPAVVLRFRVRRYTLAAGTGPLDDGLDKLASSSYAAMPTQTTTGASCSTAARACPATRRPAWRKSFGTTSDPRRGGINWCRGQSRRSGNNGR